MSPGVNIYRIAPASELYNQAMTNLMTNHFWDKVSDLFVRYSLAFLLFSNSYDNVVNYVELQSWLSLHNVTGLLLPVLIVIEVLGAAALLMAWQTLYVAIVLALVAGLSARLFDSGFSWMLSIGFAVLAVREAKKPRMNNLWHPGTGKRAG